MDHSESFDFYSTKSLLSKYNVDEGKIGEEKNKATVELVERMRQKWNLVIIKKKQ